MKKSQVISLFIMIVVVTVLIIIGGLFRNDNKVLKNEPTTSIINNTPSATLIKNSSTPNKTTTSSVAPSPSATEVSGQPIVFPGIDKEKLSNLSTATEEWGVNFEGSNPVIPYKVQGFMKDYNFLITQNADKKVVYLTFDESYENGLTTKILDTLKEKNIKAIFFITGDYIDSQPDLVKRMVAEGHLVGNHTNKHKIMPELSIDDFTKELLDLEAKYRNLVGQDKRMLFYRPPEGSYSVRDLAAAQQLEYKLTLWSFAYKDYDPNAQLGADVSYNKIMSKLHNGGIYLLNAVSKDNSEILGKLIDNIKAQGYEIKRLDQ